MLAFSTQNAKEFPIISVFLSFCPFFAYPKVGTLAR